MERRISMSKKRDRSKAKTKSQHSSRTPKQSTQATQPTPASVRTSPPVVLAPASTEEPTRNQGERIPSRVAIRSAPPLIAARYLEEPLLAFCGGRDVAPKSGITTFGPYTLGQPGRHPRNARIGILGTAETMHAARKWILAGAQGIDGGGSCPSFPGCSRDAGYFVDLIFDEAWNAKITQHELALVLTEPDPRTRFEAATRLLEDKLAWFAALDRPPDYVALALPDDLVAKCAVADYKDGKHMIHRDLRLVIKATAMRYRLTTQILLGKTIRGGKGVDHRADCAWNFFTTLYFKLGAVPWSAVGLAPDTCYIGISFYRPLGTTTHMQASLAQVFNAAGDALVIRGEEFPWSPSRQEKSPHLDSEQAKRLVEAVLKRYRVETQGKTPRRVVIHKSSRFWPDEASGFRAALTNVSEFDLVSVAATRDIRLLRQGTYPVLRGTQFTVGDIDFLYTTGFIHALDEFPHGHVPSPLRLADHRGGDTPVDDLLREIMILTKLNWNSADFGALNPITLGSSREVGDVLREVPPSQEPLAQYKYYV
jgi:hypothetical protein